MPKGIQEKQNEATILTVHEVAEYLRMSQAKVYRLAKEGDLPVVRIGRAWRFRKDLPDQWYLPQVAERETPQSPDAPEESLLYDEYMTWISIADAMYGIVFESQRVVVELENFGNLIKVIR